MKKIFLISALVILMGQGIYAQCNTNISGTLTACGCNGSVTFTSSNGTPPFNLVVSAGPSVQYSSSYTWMNVCPGSYHYDITDAALSCHDTGTVTVTGMPTVVPPPLTIEAYNLSGSPIGNNPTICQFQSIDFYVQLPFENTEPKTFKWKKNGIIVLTQTAINPSPPGIAWNSSSLASGDVISLTVIFTAPPPCYSPDSVISQNITFTVTPNQPPSITVSSNAINDTNCHGNAITFTGNPIEAGTPTYQWYLDGVPVGTASTYTTPVTLANGNHQVYCIMTSGDYCDTQDPVFNPTVISDSILFYIDPCYFYAPVTGTLGPYTTCNSPFYDSALDTPVNYSNNANGLVKFCPAVPGQYISISFMSLNLADGGDRLRIFSGTPSSTWTADTSAIPLFNIAGPVNSSGPVVTSNVPGGCLTAHFRSDAVGNAAGWVANITCSPLSALEPNIAESGINIYPNPASGELKIQNAKFKIERVELYNTLGEKILSQRPTGANKEQFTIDVSSLSPGIYFVKVKGEKGESVGRFVKQ